MTGIIIMTTDGKENFIAHTCEYCQMDSAGNHSSNCSNNIKKDTYGCNTPRGEQCLNSEQRFFNPK